MNITWRRHYKLVVALVILLIGLLGVSSVRLIAYNFGEGRDINTYSLVNYTNDVELFDDTVMHEVRIDMSPADYEIMVNTYKETDLKDFFAVDVTIDGVTISNVGIRLKGNLTLRQSLGTDNKGEPGIRWGENNDDGQAGAMPGRRGLPDMEDLPEELQDKMARLLELEAVQAEEQKNNVVLDGVPANNNQARPGFDQMGGGPGGMMGESSNPPFLLKFDEFVPGQTYQGYAEVAVRIGSNKALLNEPVAYYLHQQAGQIVPQTAYAAVSIADLETSLYVICEHIDEKYVANHFVGIDSILYKAGNFTGFEYLGDDPSLYSDRFEQKTSVNDDDLVQLIEFMKFVTESSDQEFAEYLPQWLDIDSFIKLMALDNLLSNNDSFVGMGSNYYLLFNKDTEQFTMLSWDLNLAMGGMGGGGMGGQRLEGMEDMGDRPNFNPMDMNNVNESMVMSENIADNTETTDTEEEIDERQAIRNEIMQAWLAEGGFEQDGAGGDRPGGMQSKNNLLRDRFFANEEFLQRYEEVYIKLKAMIYDQGLALAKTEQLRQIFNDYNTNHNLVEQTEYDQAAEQLVSYIKTQKDNNEIKTIQNSMGGPEN